MSLKNRFFSIFTIAVGLVVFSAFTFAQETKTETTAPDKAEKRMKREGRGFGKGEHGGFGMRHGGFKGLRGIELTDAQKEQIRVIRENNKPDETVMQELRAIHEARKAGTEITPEQQERVKVLREQFRAKAKSVHEQIMAILTVEQKAQIEKNKLEMKQRHEERKLQRQQKPAVTTTEKPIS